MFKIEFIGNVGADATIKNIGEANVINLKVAVNLVYTDKLGEKKKSTTWVDCDIWNRPKLQEYLKKGEKVYITGSPDVRAYIPKDSTEPVAIQVCKVSEIEFLSKKENAND